MRTQREYFEDYLVSFWQLGREWDTVTGWEYVAGRSGFIGAVQAQKQA